MRLVTATMGFRLGALLPACIPLAAHAQVYRCTAPNGSVAYQDRPCASGQRQKVLDLPSRPPPGYVPPAPPASIPHASASPPPLLPASEPPPTPLPAMYACVGAVNGKHYLTRNPPPPYLAPLGVMGYPPQTLAQAYGAPGGAGMSAPGMARPRIGGPPIAAGMTEVEDACAPAPKAQVCAYVEREYDQNHHKLQRAMRNEKPPYEQREQRLQSQLRNCR